MRALVVGLGRMGTFHAKVLHELGYDITTVDPDPERGADYRTIGQATTMGTAYGTHDIAVVAAPIPHLADCAFQLAGIKHLLVEKPFATTAQEASMLHAYLKAQGSSVCVGYVERYNPVIREYAQRIRQMPRHGSQLAVTFTRWTDQPSADTGLDMAVHDIDLAWHLGLGCEDLIFDTRADQNQKLRRLRIGHDTHLDLMAHNGSPLHALWHSFLTGQQHPGPLDAIRTLQHLEAMQQPQHAAA
jgi:predicted dehydrogenase